MNVLLLLPFRWSQPSFTTRCPWTQKRSLGSTWYDDVGVLNTEQSNYIISHQITALPSLGPGETFCCVLPVHPADLVQLLQAAVQQGLQTHLFVTIDLKKKLFARTRRRRSRLARGRRWGWCSSSGALAPQFSLFRQALALLETVGMSLSSSSRLSIHSHLPWSLHLPSVKCLVVLKIALLQGVQGSWGGFHQRRRLGGHRAHHQQVELSHNYRTSLQALTTSTTSLHLVTTGTTSQRTPSTPSSWRWTPSKTSSWSSSWSCRSWRRWGRSQGGRACLTTTTSSLTTSGGDSLSSSRKRSRICVHCTCMYLKEISGQRTCFSGRSATTLPSTTSSPRKSALAEFYLRDLAYLTSQLHKPIQIFSISTQL